MRRWFPGYAVTMLGADGGEGLEDHEVEGSLQEIEFGFAQFPLLC